MTVTISPAELADLPAIAALLEEMDRFYGVTEFEPPDERVAQIQAHLFRDHPAAFVLLARADHQVVGLASYSLLWPAVGLTQSLYLKELYVVASHRRQSIGQALMQRLHAVAAETGCSRVEWTADAGNAGAQRFYAELGYKVADKLFYRVEGEDLNR